MSTRDLEAENGRLKAQVKELERQLLRRQTAPAAELALTDSAPLTEKLAAMLAFAPASIYEMDLSGNLLHVTARTDKSHLVGTSIFDQVHTDGRHEYRYRLDQVLAVGEPIEFEYKACDNDTEARWYRVQLSPWRKDGQIVGAVAVCAAIDDERQARIESKRFRAILDQAGDAIFVVDPRSGKYLDVNTTACQLLGYRRSELLALDLRQVEVGLALDSRGKWADFMIQIMAEGTLVREGQYRRKDGGVFPVEEYLSIKPFEGDEYLLVVSRDITEATRIKEELRVAEQSLRVNDRLTTVGTLAAGVAHEINNPLAYVMGNLEFAVDQIEEVAAHIPEPLRHEVVESLHEARHGAGRMIRIVRDLRTFSRRDDDSTGPVLVNEVLDSSINIAMNEIRPRARLFREYTDGLLVTANEPRLGQVFLNLIINAAQAIEPGDSKNQHITVRTHRDGDEVVIEVSDSGPGMSREVAGRIFEAFFTTKPVGAGTGLGLSICQNIVSAMGGEIRVFTEVGKGTTFQVRLPAASKDAPAPRPGVVSQGRSTRTGRILIIDDDVRAAKALRRILHVHEVSIEHDGRNGLDRIAEESFDMIFCDMMMPDFGGIEFYEALKEDFADMAQRVVFVTGGTFTQRAREFLEEPDKVFVSKPYDSQEVRRLVSDRLR